MDFKNKMVFWLKTITEDKDHYLGVSILYSEPKLFAFQKYQHIHLDDYRGLCKYCLSLRRTVKLSPSQRGVCLVGSQVSVK